MIMKNGKQIGFIYKNGKKIDKIIRHGKVYFEQGFTIEKTSTALPINFDGIGKNLKDYRIYGNVHQNSTDGKNLLNPKLKSNGDRGITGEYNNETFEITITGTPTAIFANIGSNVNFETPLPIGTYTISTPEIKEFRIGIHLYKSGGDIGNYAIALNKKELQITVTDEITGYYLYIYGLDTSKQYNDKFKVMFESGSTATNFEPYTNGASPNPDYPQEIVDCGNKTKNLLPTDTIAYEIGTISSSTGLNQNNTARIRTKDYYPITIGDYHISIEDSNYSYVNIEYYDANKNFLYAQNSIQNITDQNISITNENVTYFRSVFKLISNDDITPLEILNIKPMITLGNTKLNFEPYGYKIPVNVRSDNLYVNDNQTYQFTTNDATWRFIDGSTGASGSNVKNTIYKAPVIQGETYNFSVNINASSNIITQLIYDDEVAIKRIDNSNIEYNETFTATKTGYVILRCYVEANISVSTSNIMLVKSSTIPLKYIPYYNETINIYLDEPLRKVDEYNDYIDFKNKKVIRNIKELILNGSESWTESSTNNADIKRWRHNGQRSVILHPSSNNENAKLLSESFQIKTAGQTYTRNEGISVDTSGDILIYYPSIISGPANFKTWLSNNNVLTIFALQTPTEENIELPNIPTIDGNNILNIETEITPSQIYIKYKSNN